MTDECTTCEECGKPELRGTVHLVHEDGGETYAGTTCAARMLGTTAARVRGMVKARATQLEIWEGAIRDEFRKLYGKAWIAANTERAQREFEWFRRMWFLRWDTALPGDRIQAACDALCAEPVDRAFIAWARESGQRNPYGLIKFAGNPSQYIVMRAAYVTAS